MKKVVSLLLVLAMVLTMMPMSVLASEGVTICFDTDFTNDLVVGDTFTVTATLENNPTIGTMTLSLVWNEEAIEFTGFNMNGRVLASTVFDSTKGYQSPTVNRGKIVAVDELGYDQDGVLFTANFKIVGDGELGIGLNTETAADFQIRNLEGTADIPANLDFSAVQGLTVGGKPVGPEMPEDAPFTAITTDAGPIVAIEEADWVNGVPYYIVTIPADAETAYVTAPDQVVMEDWTTGKMQATAYASVLTFDSEPLYISYDYEDTADGPKVEIPMEMTSTDWSGNEVKLSFFSNDEYNPATHAFGIEDASYACLGWISFVYDDGLEEYNISIDENMVGGTIYACDEDGNEISKARAGETVFVEVEADEGYTTTGAYYINGQIANDFMFVMPEEDVVLTATFQKQHTHVYDKEVAADKYLKDAATCQHAAEYFKSCECGATSEETFFDGETVGCVYENGTCKWCGAAEPVVAPGYRFATSADVSAENGGTAVVKVKITGHSDENITSYNAYDVTLTFDSDKLEYVGYDGAVKSDNGSVTVSGNTIRIVGCGAGKDFGTEIAALTFKTKAEGDANVTIDKVQVSDKKESVEEDAPEAAPKHDEDDTTADETPDVSVIQVPYSVTKPDFITGNNKVVHGETYTFFYTDTANYTYVDLTVKVGGTAVENLTPDENGVYTIENVTGAIEITATQTPNSYDVSKPENVTGPDKATYGEDYIFTVTPSEEDMAIDTVKVTLADETEIPYTLNENGEYVIEGTDITGAFTITVTEKEKMTTVTFSGIEATEIEGGLTQSAEIGKEFTFKLTKVEGFDYTVMVGGTKLTESEETEGQYTIPAELVVKGSVAVTIEKVDNTKPVVDVAEYISLDRKVMYLVTAKWGDRVLAYGEDTMFWSGKYTVTGETEAGAYCWLVLSTEEMSTVELVKAAAEAAIVEAAEGTTATSVKYNFDINGTTKVDVNDAQLAYDMYNASYMEFSENLPMLKFLEADMETDAELDTKDVASIINYIVSGANA